MNQEFMCGGIIGGVIGGFVGAKMWRFYNRTPLTNSNQFSVNGTRRTDFGTRLCHKNGKSVKFPHQDIAKSVAQYSK